MFPVRSLISDPAVVSGPRPEAESGAREPSASQPTATTASIVPGGSGASALPSFARTFRSQPRTTPFSAIHLQGEPGTAYQVSHSTGSSLQRLYTSNPDTGAPQPTERFAQRNSEGEWVLVTEQQPKATGTSVPSSSGQDAAAGVGSRLSIGGLVDAAVSNFLNAADKDTTRVPGQPQASSHSARNALRTHDDVTWHQKLDFALSRGDMATVQRLLFAPDSSVQALHASDPGSGRQNLHPDLLERAIERPLEVRHSLNLAKREAIPPPKAIELLYELQLHEPVANYVRSFLQQLGYDIDPVHVGARTHALKATQLNSDTVFYLHPRLASGLITTRPAALVPNAPNLLAVVKHGPLGRTPPGHLFLINLAPRHHPETRIDS